MTGVIADSLTGQAMPTSARSTVLSMRGAVQRSQFRLDVDLSVHPGEVVGILGPNGAGKSTLLRALSGLCALTEGRIRLGGRVLDDADSGVFVPAEHRPVGLVFQNYRLFPHLTVRDNVAFAQRAQGLGKRASRQHADSWLERLGLADLANHRPGHLSGGQSQRVALARTLAANPAALLLDEPLAALDARTKLEVRTELRRHLADFDGPTLIVTHDPLEAMVMTDRLVVIEHGRIVQEGSPAEVATRPATQYIARLVGLNLSAGVLVDHDTVELDGGGRIVATGASTLTDAGRVLVAVRPSAISLHASRPRDSSARNVWPGTIGAIELLTDRVRVQVTGEPSALVDITPDALAELNLADGRRVWLSAKATDIDVYLNTDSS